MPPGSPENRRILPIDVEGGEGQVVPPDSFRGHVGRRDGHVSSAVVVDGRGGERVNDSGTVASRRIQFKVGLVSKGGGGSFSAP